MSAFDDFLNWLHPYGQGSAARNSVSNFISQSPGPSQIPQPPVINQQPMYDEGSRFREATNQAALLNKGPSIGDIMSQLQQLSDPNRYAVDPASLLAQARAAASAQYDPLIAQLRGQESSAQTRAGQNKVALGAMFNQLSNSLQGDIPALEQKSADTKQATQQAYTDLNNKISNTYDQTQASQEAMMKRLGIEAAAPDVTGQQAKDRSFFLNSANNQAQTAQTALDTEQRGNTEYTRRGSEVARTEGTQRQADLMFKLQDVLASYENQIGANQAAKSQAIQAGLGQLTQQAQQQAQTASQRDFDNYLKSMELGRELKADDLKSLLTGQVNKTQSPADVAGRALTLGLKQPDAQSIQNVFTNAIGSDPVILSGLDPTAGTAAPKEALAARVVQKGRESGLSQAQLNALQTIALEYFGRV